MEMFCKGIGIAEGGGGGYCGRFGAVLMTMSIADRLQRKRIQPSPFYFL